MAHIPYGYRIKTGVAMLDKKKAAQVRALFKEYIGGLALQAAAEKLDIPRSHASLGHMLADARYTGDGFYPAIVDEELFGRAQDERKKRVEALGRNKNRYDHSDTSPFWGRVFCAECGSEYRRYSNDDKERWKCGRRIVNGRLHCNSPMIPEAVFETAFVELLTTLNMTAIKAKPPKVHAAIERKYDDPFRQAEYAYSLVEVDDFGYQTAKMAAALVRIPAGFDGGHMARVIRRITVSHNGMATFEMINGKTYEKELIFDDIRKERIGDTGAYTPEQNDRG
jgi:hypothetical protein